MNNINVELNIIKLDYKKMNINTLELLANNKLSVRQAYRKIFKAQKVKKAFFYKARIKIKGEKVVSKLINMFLFIPAPAFIIRAIFKISANRKSDKFDFKTLQKFVGVKPFFIEIIAEDVFIYIKAI